MKASCDSAGWDNPLIDCFENWLLDDEQQQELKAVPQARFILYAAAYLYDIGQAAFESGPPGDAPLADISDASAYNSALTVRTAALIRSDWQRLGIGSAGLAETSVFVRGFCIRM